MWQWSVLAGAGPWKHFLPPCSAVSVPKPSSSSFDWHSPIFSTHLAEETKCWHWKKFNQRLKKYFFVCGGARRSGLQRVCDVRPQEALHKQRACVELKTFRPQTVVPDQQTDTCGLCMCKYEYICGYTCVEQCFFKTTTVHRQSVSPSALGANLGPNQTWFFFFAVEWLRCLLSPARHLCSAWLN